jgi:hypothetical protein
MNLVSFLTSGSPTLVAMNVGVSIVAIAIGDLIAASPDRAAKIWGWQRLANSTAEHRPVIVGWYRAFGICLCLAGVLLAVDNISS